VGNLEKIDTRKTVNHTIIVNSLEDVKKDREENVVYLLEATEDIVQDVANSSEKVYIPSTSLTSVDTKTETYVYFELESYPFFQNFKKLVNQQKQTKGVLRFRRVMLEENSSIMASDLYVLSSTFGAVESVHVKQSKRQAGLRHTILLVYFGSGIMSHIEYTVANEERIELELSGIKSIVEFNSDHMKPIQAQSKTRLPLSYTADEIIASSRKVDGKLIKQLQEIRQLIEGGDSA